MQETNRSSRSRRDEQPHPLALAKPEDADRDLEQVVGVDLHQQVARQGLEDVDQALGVMAVGGEAGVVHDVVELVAQQRDLPRAGLVGGGGVQAEEPALADHLAVGANRLTPT